MLQIISWSELDIFLKLLFPATLLSLYWFSIYQEEKFCDVRILLEKWENDRNLFVSVGWYYGLRV